VYFINDVADAEGSDVIYTIMSDEQRRQRPKGPRPFRLQRKSAATRRAEIMSFDPNLSH
jgi:hypothetical protein